MHGATRSVVEAARGAAIARYDEAARGATARYVEAARGFVVSNINVIRSIAMRYVESTKGATAVRKIATKCRARERCRCERDCIARLAAPTRVAIYNVDPTRYIEIATSR